MKEVWEREDYQQKHSIIMSNTWENKKDEIRNKLKEKWTDPEVKRKHAASITAEIKTKMKKTRAANHLLVARSILQLTLSGVLIKEWRYPKEAINVYGSHVSSVLNKKRKHTHGFIFKYKDGECN